MLSGIPLAELAWLAAAILVGGVATGILAGVFGIGGGAVIVPVLYETFRVMGVSDDVRMQLCVGTSLAIIVPTTLRSYRAHRRIGKVGVPPLIRVDLNVEESAIDRPKKRPHRPKEKDAP